VPLTKAQREKNRYLNPVPTNVGGLSVMFKVGPRIIFGGAARTPKHRLGPLLTDRHIYETKPRSGLRMTWFGHASSLIEIDGVTLLIDPVWDERAAPTQWAGPKRFFPPPLPLEELPPIDAVIISHDHYDTWEQARFSASRAWRTFNRHVGSPRSAWARSFRVSV